MGTRGAGQAVQWLRDHADYQYDYCLMWPFASRCRGYGQLGYLGKVLYAHRLMCEFVHGPAPSDTHQAAHSCGRGHEACVNPRHLSWKTPTENLLDSGTHGTQARSNHGNQGRLSKEEAHQIWLMKGVKLQREIAELFKVSESTVSDIWCGRSHARESKVKPWTPEEDAKLLETIDRKMSFKQAGKYIGRGQSAVSMRAYRLGLKSGYELNRPRNPVST